MADIGGAVKMLFVLAICGGVFYGFWLTLDKGGEIAGMGKGGEAVEGAKTAEAAKVVAPKQPALAAPVGDRIASSPPAQATRPGSSTVYKWVDEKGTVHFSDKPLTMETERIEVAPVTTLNFPQPRSAQAAPVSYPQGTSAREPARRQPSGEDYRFSVVGGFQKNRDEVVLSGRVAGPGCKSLQIGIQAVSSNGRSVHASTVVRDVDFGSRLFEVSARATYDSRKAPPRWDVSDLRARCLD